MTDSRRKKLKELINDNSKGEVLVDFGGTTVTGIAAVAYRDLVDYLGLDTDIKVFDMMHQMSLIDEEVKHKFNSVAEPLLRPRPRFGIPIYNGWKKGKLSDGTECLIPEGFSPEKEEGSWFIKQDGVRVAKRSEKSEWFDPIYHPLKGKDEISDLRGFDLRQYSDEDRDYLRQESEKLVEGSDRAIIATISKDVHSSLMESAQLLRGYDTFLMDLGRRTDYVNYLLDMIVDNFKKNFDALYEEAGERVDFLKFSDDYGAQDNLLISPDKFRRFFKPRIKEMIDYVKEKSGYGIFFHSDGAIRDIIPDLIETGVDALNPVQTSCSGMEPASLEEEFGEDLVFWGGGLDTQALLPGASKEEIREQVEERIRTFTRNGSYVFATIHNIPPGTSPEIVETIFETANKFIKE